MTSQNRRPTMKDNQAKYPQLRFKGFTDPWEQRRLSEIVTEHNSGVYIAKDEYGSGTNIIGVGDIYESDLVDGQVFRLAPVKDEKFILHSRDLLYGESSLVQEGIARVVSVTDKGAGTAFAWHTRRFVVDPVVADSQFVMLELNYWFPAREHLMRTATKTALTGITTQDFFSTNILVPILLEQKKICDLVRRLDNLITVNQRKLAKLKELKQGYLQKLFPKNGSKFPQLRFAGFADAWKQRKLGGIMDVTSVKRIHQSDWTNKGVRFFRARDIVALSKREKIQDPLFISEQKYNEYSKSSGKVHVDDLLVTGVGSIGIPYLVKSTNPLYFKDGNIIWFKNNGYLDGSFLYYSFIGNSIQNYIKKTSGSGTVGTFTIMSGKKTPILIPKSYKEQQKIGSFFKSLDDTITLHQRKLEKLQELKKGYLQKMFC